MFVGQSSALGLSINIPIVIRSLAASQFYPKTDSLSFNLGTVLALSLAAIVEDHIPTRLVETYSLNWWDDNKVRKKKT